MRKLKEKYEVKNTRQAINRALRAEMVGGDDLLDALEKVNRLANRLKERGLAGKEIAFEALTKLTELRDFMIRILLERYK